MHTDDKLTTHFRILPAQQAALKRLGVETVGDLLYHFPARYGDTAEVAPTAGLAKGAEAVSFGVISELKSGKTYRSKMTMSEATLTDDTGKVKLVWFNQPYMAKLLFEGATVRVEGRVSERKGELYFSNPKVERIGKLPVAVGNSLFSSGSEEHALYPVYPETRGLTSNWIFHKLNEIFNRGILNTVEDPIPEEILKRYHLPDLKTSLVWIHTPKAREHAEAARKRFAFEEIFFIQLERQRSRLRFKREKAFIIDKGLGSLGHFIDRLPFKATTAQLRAITEILSDFKKGSPMARLLEGDVGSGKTAVAAAAAYAATTSRPRNELGLPALAGTLQTAYMAPTEILANQHFLSFISFFRHMPVNIGLITGSGCKKFPSKVNPSGATDISRAQLLRWVASGEISVLVGTHALIQKSVRFKHLALVVIDEQHRFGTAQRQSLATKEALTPHLLSMTATPIPRTLALTLYGDLDLTLLDEMPEGRKAIITDIVLPSHRENMYEKVRRELREGRQAYVICPRIDEPDPNKETAILAKSVKAEAARLKKKVFPEFDIDIVHSKMTPAAKEEAMRKFKDGKTDILVATSVVEVGVNVPNATVIVIEGAERFGLAQLHQLRGRVQRSSHQAYCFVYAESTGEKTLERLKALKTAKNGFELSELDLKQRGAGQLSGAKQWGISDIGMEAIKNLKMVEAAREEARAIIFSDPTLAKHPLLKARLSREGDKVHLE